MDAIFGVGRQIRRSTPKVTAPLTPANLSRIPFFINNLRKLVQT